MDTARIILAVVTALGFAITVWGLVAAYVSAGREYRDAEARVAKMQELGDAEMKEARGRIASPPSNEAEAAAQLAEANARDVFYTAEYEKYGLVRPTYDNMVMMASYESRRLLGLVLSSTRRDFLIAAFGLLVSTVASVGSLFLAT